MNYLAFEKYTNLADNDTLFKVPNFGCSEILSKNHAYGRQ